MGKKPKVEHFYSFNSNFLIRTKKKKQSHKVGQRKYNEFLARLPDVEYG